MVFYQSNEAQMNVLQRTYLEPNLKGHQNEQQEGNEEESI